MKHILFPKYRWVVLSLYILTTTVSCSTYQSSSPLITSIMRDLGISYAEAGLLATVMLIVSGLTILLGSRVTHRLGLRGSVILENGLLFAGNSLTFLSRSFETALFGRFAAGIGFGLGGLINSMIAPEWFSEKEQPLVNAGNQFFTQAGFVLALLCGVPIAVRYGNWRGMYLAISVLNLVSLLASAVFFFNNPEYSGNRSAEKGEEINREKENAGFVNALKRRDVRIMAGGLAAVTFSSMSFSVFLPSFLENTKAASASGAGAMTSIIPTAALAAALSCGIIMSAAGVRKPILITATALMLAGALTIALTADRTMLYVGIVLFGLGSGSQQCVLYTVVAELRNAGAALIAGATSAVFGICNIVSFAVSFVFDSLQSTFGVTVGMALTAMPLLIGIILYCLMPETGPGRTSNEN